jgi:hypothetical protein
MRVRVTGDKIMAMKTAKLTFACMGDNQESRQGTDMKTAEERRKNMAFFESIFKIIRL